MIISATEEQWKPVPVEDYSRAYEVSTLGRVRGIDRIGSSDFFIRRIRGVIMKGRICSDGSKTVSLSVNRKRAKFCVDWLVASAFIANPHGYVTPRHLNNDLSDNRAVNLAWGTETEVMQEATC